MGRGGLVVLALLAVASPAAAAPPVPNADYTATFGGKGNLSFSTSKDRRRLYAPQGGDLPADCNARTRHKSISFSDVHGTEVARISPGGRFSRRFLGEKGPWLRGRFLAGGRVRGRISYRLGRCRAILDFTGRARKRGPGLRGRAFWVLSGGIPGRMRDGMPANAADFIFPSGADHLPDGSLLFSVRGYNFRDGAVYRVDPDGRLTTLKTGLDSPDDIAVLPDGSYLLAMGQANCVTRVRPDGSTSVAAGRCDYTKDGFSGDGGPATDALMTFPRKLSVIPDGGFLVTDGGAYGGEQLRVRRVAPDGTITTVAGNGHRGSSGDGGPATAASFTAIHDVAADPAGGFLIADHGAARVRRVAPDGTISTVAGTGLPGTSGDGVPATAARVVPESVEAYRGGFLISELQTGRIRRVSADGRIDSLAGGGERPLPGLPARDSASPFAETLDALPSGAVLADRRLFAPTSEPRLLVGTPVPTRSYRRAVAHRGKLPIFVSRAAHVVVAMRHGRRVLLRASRTVPAGRSALRLPGALVRPRRRSPKPFQLTVTATSGRAIATTFLNLY
jgi:hypothetical protein